MALKTFFTEFKNIGQQEFLRSNFGYRYFFDVQKAKVYSYPDLIKLKYVLKEVPAKKVKKGELEQPEKLIDLANIERRFNNLIDIQKVEEIGSDKNILQSGDLIIPKMQPQMGNIFLNLKHERFIGSTELLEYKINDHFNPTFLYYLITSKRFLNDLAKLESGKTHRRVNPIDLLKIKIPKIPKPIQDQTVARIEPIEHEIKQLKSQIKPPQEIINKVFAIEFGFDLEKFEETTKEKFFEVDFSKLSYFENLNLLPKFNKFLNVEFQFINKISKIKLKKFIDKHYSGEYIPSKHYVNDSNLAYVSVGNFTGDKPDFDNVKLLDENLIEKYESIKLKSKDIIFTRSASVGSVHLIKNIPSNKIFIPSHHLLIVRLKNNDFIIPEFLEYWLKIGFIKAFLVNFSQGKIQKELTNWSVFNVSIPNIPLSQQQKIVNEIKTELDNQKHIEKQIEEKRNEIDKIIEEVINN